MGVTIHLRNKRNGNVGITKEHNMTKQRNGQIKIKGIKQERGL